MNERIQALWEQAAHGDGPHASVIADFAELIVRECAQVSEDDVSDGDACCTNTADRIARQIKKHFGIEE